MDNPHEPKRADQIGTPQKDIAELVAKYDARDMVKQSAIREQALSLAIQSFDKPLRDVSPAMFIGRAVAFETYLATGKVPDVPAQPVELSGSRAYVEETDGTFRSV